MSRHTHLPFLTLLHWTCSPENSVKNAYYAALRRQERREKLMASDLTAQAAEALSALACCAALSEAPVSTEQELVKVAGPRKRLASVGGGAPSSPPGGPTSDEDEFSDAPLDAVDLLALGDVELKRRRTQA